MRQLLPSCARGRPGPGRSEKRTVPCEIGNNPSIFCARPPISEGLRARHRRRTPTEACAPSFHATYPATRVARHFQHGTALSARHFQQQLARHFQQQLARHFQQQLHGGTALSAARHFQQHGTFSSTAALHWPSRRQHWPSRRHFSRWHWPPRTGPRRHCTCPPAGTSSVLFCTSLRHFSPTDRREAAALFSDGLPPAGRGALPPAPPRTRRVGCCCGADDSAGGRRFSRRRGPRRRPEGSFGPSRGRGWPRWVG